MKRTVLVLAIVAALSVPTVSTAYASPAAGERATALAGWLSCYIADFLRAHASGDVDLQVIETGTDERLGGDADDYANGKGDGAVPEPDDRRANGQAGGGLYGSGTADRSF